MTDEPDALHADPDAEAVRRLLADARHTGPMPDDVVDRMDAVLADLADSPVGAEGPPLAPVHPVVVSLAAQRRHRAAGMLVAAAAIVVGGVVVAQHLPGSSSQSNPSAASRAEDKAAGSTSGQRVRPQAPQANSLDLSAGAAKIRGGRLLVRPQHFTVDALAGRRVLERKTPRSAYASLSGSASFCGVSGAGGERVRATYQRAPAVLVFHAPGSSSQVVDLYLCGSSSPVRSATLPSP